MKKSMLATFSAAAIAVSVIFPLTNNGSTDPLADPIAIAAVKTDTHETSFIGFVIGQTNELEYLPDARGYNTVIEMQQAFKQYLMANNIQIVVGEHGYSIKRLFDSMFGNQIIDLNLRQRLEVIDLVGAIQASYPLLNTIEAYGEEHGLHLPPSKPIMNRCKRVAAIYVDLFLDRLIQRGVAPTRANMMPYRVPTELMAA